MKNKKLTVVFIALLVLSCFNSFVIYAFASPPEFRRVIVGFKENPSEDLILQHGGRIKYSYKSIRAIACWLSLQAINALEKNPQVEYIEEDVIVSLLGKPDKPPKPPKPPNPNKPSKKGFLEIHAFLDGSEISVPYQVNGVWTGITPDTVELNPAVYTVTVTYEDETQEQTAEVFARQTTRVDFQFTTSPPSPPPQNGYLTVDAQLDNGTSVSANIDVYSDGILQYQDLTPFTVELEPDTYSLSATYDDQTQQRTTEILSNQTTLETFIFVAPPPPPSDIPWGIDRIDADLAWNTSTGINRQVAILDTGIDKDHPELEDNILAGISFVWSWIGPPLWNPDAWDDDMGHGTWCAGIVEDVAPDVDLVAVKVLNAMGSGYTSDIIAGIDWCIYNVIDVISMSFQSPEYSNAFHNICNEAYVQGIVLVAASGNTGDGNPSTNDVMYPAKYESVIAVSGIDENDIVASFSSDGAEVEITAPAVNINSTWMGGGYNVGSGTSAACPHVSGTVALFTALDINQPLFSGYDLNSNGKWDSWEVRNRLRDTADDLGVVGKDVFYGYGLVDAQESVTGVQTTP